MTTHTHIYIYIYIYIYIFIYIYIYILLEYFNNHTFDAEFQMNSRNQIRENPGSFPVGVTSSHLFRESEWF